jgi:hypothetical protein
MKNKITIIKNSDDLQKKLDTKDKKDKNDKNAKNKEKDKEEKEVKPKKVKIVKKKNEDQEKEDEVKAEKKPRKPRAKKDESDPKLGPNPKNTRKKSTPNTKKNDANTDEMFMLYHRAEAFEMKGDIIKAMECYLGIINNCTGLIAYIAMFDYADLAYHIGDIDQSKKYYLQIISNAKDECTDIVLDSINNYASILSEEHDYDGATKYYLLGISLGDKRAPGAYGSMLEEQGDLINAKKYYLMGCNLNDPFAMNKYAHLAEKDDDILTAIKYFQLSKDAIKNNHMYALNREDEEDEEDEEDYNDEDDDECYDNEYDDNEYDDAEFSDESIDYTTIQNNKVLEYYMLDKLKDKINSTKTKKSKIVLQKLEDIQNRIKELEKMYDIHCFKRKMELSTKIDNCTICMSDGVKTIPMECMHVFCYECYAKLHNCPYNCNKLKKIE